VSVFRFLPPVVGLLSALGGCRLERPDPVAQASAILHTHPADFIDQLSTLDAMAAKEVGLPSSASLPESLYRQSVRLKPLLARASGDSAKVAILNAWVFDSLAISPIDDSDDLAVSLPSRVLAERKGSCLGLTLLYLALGRSLDLPLRPVFLPGHIFVRYRSDAYACNIETLKRGLARTDSFYRENFSLRSRPWYTLRDGEPKQALAALVFNLGNAHRARGDWKYALEEYRLVEEAIPGYPQALCNQGAALLVTGDRKAAETKLLAAWEGDSLALPTRRNLVSIYKNAGDTLKAAMFSGR
jgi:regulator of sirC expression with transglutaminase-like and TPR domain